MTANSRIDATIREITETYQPGTLPWVKANRPNEWGTMLILEGRVNEMALGSDLRGLREVLGEYKELILDMVKEFKAVKEKKGQGMFKFLGK